MTTKLPNEQRILELERQLARVQSDLAAMKLQHSPSAPDQIIRPVKTCNPSAGSYPVSGHVVPIKFVDVDHTGSGSSITRTNRATSQQNEASTLDASLPGVDSNCIAFRYGRKWYILPSSTGTAYSKIIKTPVDGIPARSGTTVTPTECDIYDLSGTTLTATGGTLEAYSVDDAIPGDTFTIAVLLEDGSYAVMDTGSQIAIRFGKPTGTLTPGGSVEVDEQEWVAGDWVSLGEDAVTVYDSAAQNCYLPNEVMPFYYASVTGQLEPLGSFGLHRWAKAVQAVIPDQTEVTAYDWFRKYTFRLLDYDQAGATSPSLGGPGAFTELSPIVTVDVMDPLRQSMVWINQIVAISWCPELECWAIRNPVGTTQRGRVISVGTTTHAGPGSPGDMVVEIYLPIGITGQSQGNWLSSAVRVKVKREFCRAKLKVADEIEIRREPIARGTIDVNGSPQLHSAWVVSDLNNRMVTFDITESSQSQGALNRRYDLRYPDGTIFVSNWAPRPLIDTYVRLTNIAYDVGTKLEAKVAYDNAGFTGQFSVISCNELARIRTDCQ